MNLDFDLNSLTVGELVDLQDVAGDAALDRLVEKQQASPKMLLALLWILGRRDDPSFTLEQARAYKVTELKVPTVNGEDGEPAADPG